MNKTIVKAILFFAAMLVLAVLFGCSTLPNIPDIPQDWFDNVFNPDDGDGGGGGGGDDQQPAEQLPFAWSEVEWVSGDQPVGDWPIGLNVTAMSCGSTISWAYDAESLAKVKSWRRTGAIGGDPNAVIGWVAQIDGVWYGAIGEWLLPGQTQQAKKVFKSDRGNKRMFHKPLNYYEPTKGQVFYVFICGLNWNGQSNVRERSNLTEITYP